MNDHSSYKLIIWMLFLVSFSLVKAQPTPQIIGQGSHPSITVTTSNASSGTMGENTLSSEGFLPNHNAASRFLSQATFGTTYEEIVALSDQGLEDWIDAQFLIPIGFSAVDKVAEITEIKNIGSNDPDGGAWLHFWDYSYWEYAMTSSDLLRQRIAFALSEILVISQNSGFGENAYAFARFYDILLENAFRNYRDILEAVTFNPAMGVYLTYMNNPREHIDNGQVIFPDENYAREVMQLFTIGLCELNIDGTCQMDGNGVPIPTYDNEDIAEMSKIFTGLTWSNPWCTFGCGSVNQQIGMQSPMVMINEQHEPGAKTLLRGHVVQPRNPVDGVADINEALDNLFNHPNVGPFIGKLLIQRLVTSNPSPAYVERVSRAFNGESQYGNQRGDMRAIIKAILLDEEARNCAAQDDPNFGMLREPFVRYMQLAHSFKLSSVNNVYRNAMSTISQQFGQKPFTSPSVFNFFQADYQPIGPVEEAGLFAPEFQITNSQTIAGYMNELNRWLISDQMVDDWGRGFSEPYDVNNRQVLNFSDEFPLTEDNRLPELLDRLDLILAHGRVSQRTKDFIITLLLEMPTVGYSEENTIFLKTLRVRMAVLLIMSSPEYLINR